MAARSAKKDLIRLREEAKRNQKMQASSRKEYENDNLSKPNRLNSSENESMKENIKNDANASAPQIVQENSLSPNAENQNIMSSLNSVMSPFFTSVKLCSEIFACTFLLAYL